MNTTTNNMPVVRSLERVNVWELNPRGESYRDLEELKASLEREGLQDAIHVWVRLDGDYLIKGHRRFAAMRELGWTECKQVEHRFADECAAYKYLLEDHGHTVALDADEKIVAVENGVRLGMTTAELAPSLGVSEARAQLWFDLGEQLPQGARSALADGRLSMHTAELLLEVPKEARRDATQMILKDMETGEPMAHGQAKAYIHAHYVLPAKWRREWQVLEVKLKKTYKVAAGYHYVPWDDRLSYVMGDSGQPEPGWEFATACYPRDKEGRTVGEVAFAFDVPIYVVPAPLHRDGYVAVVSAAMLRDAVAVAAGGGDEEAGSGGDEETGRLGDEETGRLGDVEKWSDGEVKAAVVEDRVGRWLRVWLSAIYEALLKAPTDVMTKEPWVPLREYLAHLTTDVDAGALEAWQGITEREHAVAWIEGDAKNRAHLRTTLMLLLCAAHGCGGAGWEGERPTCGTA
jgi:ParB-like chromosome segregation protein Spo0J